MSGKVGRRVRGRESQLALGVEDVFDGQSAVVVGDWIRHRRVAIVMECMVISPKRGGQGQADIDIDRWKG